jgi:dynein intermediate chain 3, axonemal
MCTKQITFHFLRKRREFGSSVHNRFTDRDSIDGFEEFRPFRDPNFELKRTQLDQEVQAANRVVDQHSQTSWFRKVEWSTQLTFDQMVVVNEAEADEIKLKEFLQRVSPLVELNIRRNEALDLFLDDYSQLEEEEGVGGKRGDTSLKEFQYFTHIEYSKDRRVLNISWVPETRGMVAVSVGGQESFDERADGYGVVKLSYVLVWNFSDQILPQFVLEAPVDVSCFQFNESNRNLVAGGCVNGQVILWNVEKVMEMAQEKKVRRGDDKDDTVKEDSDSPIVPGVRWKYISAIVDSHYGVVTSIQWLHPSIEILPSGKTEPCDLIQRNQLITSSTDYNVCIWDIRIENPKFQTRRMRRRKSDDDFEPFWMPILRIRMARPDTGGSLGGTGLVLMDPENVKKFVLASEDGEFSMVDWAEDVEEEEEAAERPPGRDAVKLVLPGHVRSIIHLQKSPFYDDLYLTIGDWRFALWKVGLNQPVFMSPPSSSLLTCGSFSNSRPCVVSIGTMDGRAEIWDLLDRTTEPMLSQQVCSMAVTSMMFPPVPSSVSFTQLNHHSFHLLGVGDDAGTLHIMEIPRAFFRKHTNEVVNFESFINRQVELVKYAGQRSEIRDEELVVMREEEELRKKEEEKQQVLAEKESMRMRTGDDDDAKEPQDGRDPLVKLLDEQYLKLKEELLERLENEKASSQGKADTTVAST